MKKLLLLLAILSILTMTALLVIRNKQSTPTITPELQIDYDSLMYAFEDSIEHTENQLNIIDERFIPYMVNGMCGYVDEDFTQGVLTIRKTMPEKLAAKAIPQSIGQRILIAPSDYFPNGQVGQVQHIISNDTVIQYIFECSDFEAVIGEMKAQMEQILSTIGADTIKGTNY